MECRMRLFGGYCMLRVVAKWDVPAGISHIANKTRHDCMDRQRTWRTRHALPVPTAYQPCTTSGPRKGMWWKGEAEMVWTNFITSCNYNELGSLSPPSSLLFSRTCPLCSATRQRGV